MKIVLQIKGIGHVPSFKNTKQIGRNRKTKRPFIMTDPKKRRWMNRCILAIESQLFSGSAIGDGAILTAPPPRSWIASQLPLDDSRQWIPELHILSENCKKGEEGATIIIEPI